MASLTGAPKKVLPLLSSKQGAIKSLALRCICSTNAVQANGNKEGWLDKLLHVRRIETGKDSHSKMLSDKDTVYEMQVHCVKPKYMEEYLYKVQHNLVDMMHNKQSGATLAGSWTVEVGDQDEAIHIWKYKGGYPVLNKATNMYRSDKDFREFRTERNKMLRSRRNQILLEFSFWGDMQQPSPDQKHIYEMRSYILKPGTMIEWGNHWARGLQFRRDEAVGGFFSHIGELYNVHHIWAYQDLEMRKETRESAWRRPGWDECVAYTVPLIRSMQSRILIPTPFSPLQ